MLLIQQNSSHYNHDYFFEFKGEKHRIHSVVRLTEEGRVYMGFARKEVILIEVYFDSHLAKTFWKYEGKDWKYNIGIRHKSTDRPPDEIIEEVVASASADYASREMFGIDSPVYKTNATKHTKKDWEIPEVRKGWIWVILIFMFSFVFKDWYVQLLIKAAAVWLFYIYRKAYIEAYTSYTHDEDNEILKQKFWALYGLRHNKEDDDNEQDS